MFIAGNVLQGIATILDTVLWLYMWVIIVRALISWVNPDPWNPSCNFCNEPPIPCCIKSGSAWGWEAWVLIFPRSLLFYSLRSCKLP